MEGGRVLRYLSEVRTIPGPRLFEREALDSFCPIRLHRTSPTGVAPQRISSMMVKFPPRVSDHR